MRQFHRLDIRKVDLRNEAVRLQRAGRVHRYQNSFVSEEERTGCGVERPYRLARSSFLRQQLHNR